MRINIEDSVLSSDIFWKLLDANGGDKAATIGKLYWLWRKAIDYWADGQKPIPQPDFESIPNSQMLIDCGAVRKNEHGYYCRGANQYFSWIAEKREAGRRGGVASGETRRMKGKSDQETKQRSSASSKRSKTRSTNPPAPAPAPAPVLKDKDQNIYARSAEASDSVPAQSLQLVNAKKPNADKPSKRIRLNLEAYEWEGWTDQDAQELHDVYPAVDLNRELAEMVVWAKANPAKAKKSNWYKFAVNWFRRQQDNPRGGQKQWQRSY